MTNREQLFEANQRVRELTTAILGTPEQSPISQGRDPIEMLQAERQLNLAECDSFARELSEANARAEKAEKERDAWKEQAAAWQSEAFSDQERLERIEQAARELLRLWDEDRFTYLDEGDKIRWSTALRMAMDNLRALLKD